MIPTEAYIILIVIITACSSFCFYMGYIAGKTVGRNNANNERDKRTMNILRGRIDE